MTRSFIAPVAAAIVLAAPAAVRAQAPAAPIDLASRTASTVQVTLTEWGTRPVSAGEKSHIEVLRHVSVAVDVPGNRALLREYDMTPFLGRPLTPSVFVSDGKTRTEFMGSSKQYEKSAAVPLKDGPGRRTRIGAEALALALGWKNGDLNGFVPGPDEALPEGGKTLKTYVFNMPDREYQDRVYAGQRKLYVDPETRLPVRYSVATGRKGEPLEDFVRTDFSDWKLNAAIAPEQLAWTLPADAQPYKAPVKREKLAAGVVAPDFTAVGPDGKPVKLSDYKGKVVILDFWATWCGPCQMSMPHVEQVWQSVKGKDVAVLGVCVWDAKDKYDAWLPAHRSRYTFDFAFDPAGRGAESVASKLYGVSGIPATFVIGKDGKVAASLSGYGAGDTRLEDALAKLGIDVPKATAAAPAPGAKESAPPAAN